MSERFPGGIITKSPATPTGPYQTGAAPGIWTLDQQLQYQQQGVWPTAGLSPNYIEDVFSTWLYTGTGSTQTITNNIDLSTKGGLVWLKRRDGVGSNWLQNTVAGIGNELSSNSTAATAAQGFVTSVSTTGFTVDTALSASANTYASWTFRKQPKFFDVVTYTGNGVNGRAISHALGSVPGCIMVKSTSDASNWVVYHQSLSVPTNKTLRLNSTSAELTSPYFPTTPTSTVFYTNGDGYEVNTTGQTYVAYLFASNAGGFGLTGTDNVISCGGFTTTTSPDTITLGYEPQWLLIKAANSATNWYIFDNMRGIPTGGSDLGLKPNLSSAESADANFVDLTATGFISNIQSVFGDGINIIYIAIRRGPMKVPTDATKVFSPIAVTPTSNQIVTTGFPVDLSVNTIRTGGVKNWMDRLRGGNTATSGGGTYCRLFSDSTAAENSGAGSGLGFDINTGLVENWNTGSQEILWSFQRAPSFFDEVCYTGDNTQRTINHNLAAAPELIIVKIRSASGFNWEVWSVYTAITPPNGHDTLKLNLTNAAGPTGYFPTDPTSSVFTISNNNQVNSNGNTFVAYLFATCAGVSKVGSYTGNGTTQTINCGFTGGARFVLIKRTDSTGDWYVYDTARGMTVLTDPYLLLNSNAAETATLGSVTTVSTGFALNSTILADINVSAGSYIFLAIA